MNASDALFGAEFGAGGQGVIRYALAAIRNVGRQAMEHVVEVRKAGGAFLSLFDFARRIDPRLVNKRAFENLAKAGAFDALNPNRAQVLASADLLLAYAAGAARDRGAGQNSLFGEAEPLAEPALPKIAAWTPLERLAQEFEAIGFYLSGHPLDGYAKELARARVAAYAQVLADGQRQSRLVKLAGTVIRKQLRKSQKGNPFAFVGLSDPTGVFEAIVFSDTLQQAGPLLEPGSAVVVQAFAEWDQDELKLRVQTVAGLEQVAAEAGAGLRIWLDEPGPLEHIAGRLPKGGQGAVSLMLRLKDGREVEMGLNGRYAVTPQVAQAIKAIAGVSAVDEI